MSERPRAWVSLKRMVMVTGAPWAALFAASSLYFLFSNGALLGIFGALVLIGGFAVLTVILKRRAGERSYHPHLRPADPLIHDDV